MYTIQKHLNYSHWATSKIAELLQNADENIFDKEIVSSFPSIRKTIMHIWDAEVIWLNRLKGTAMLSWPSEGFNGTTKELLERWAHDSHQLAQFVEGKDRAFLEMPIHYKNLKGLEFSTPAEEILFHVVNHGSFHRGQLITMLRQAGITQLPSTDLIAYVRQFSL
jgi:uncharacterized damage-inducible protein DinB